MNNNLHPGKSNCKTKSERQQLIDNWLQSGQSKKKFCREHQLNYLTFVGWTRKRNKKTYSIPETSESSFIPIKISPSPEIFAEICLANGTKVILYHRIDRSYFRYLLK